MKTKIYNLCIVALLSASFSSCELKDDLFGKKHPAANLPDNMGMLDLKLDPQKEVTGVGNATRATDESLDVNDFAIQILDEKGNLVESYDSYADIEEVYLNTGTYHIVAKKGVLKDAGYDMPYYEGNDTCVINSKEVAQVVTPCVLSNKKITVAYTDEFLERFKNDYEVVMTNGNGVLTLKSNEERKPFFKTTDQLDFVLHATTTAGLDMQYYCDLYNDKKVKEYNNIVVWLDVAPDTIPTPDPTPDPDPNPDPTPDPDPTPSDSLKRPIIKVDIQLVEKNYTIEIPSNFIPGEGGGGTDTPDNPGGSTSKPIIKGDGFDMDSPITITSATAGSTKVVVNMTLPTGVESMKVTISSDNSSFMGAVADIGNPFDMLNLNSMQSNLLESVKKGQKSVRFDVSSFMSLLTGFPGTHKFKIDLKDQNGQSNSKTLTIIAK